MKSFKDYNGKVVIMENGALASGTYFINECMMRFKKGLLNNEVDDEGNVLPAIEKNDGTHVEYWEDGKLHREKEPAVIDLLDNIEEWWLKGHKVTAEQAGK